MSKVNLMITIDEENYKRIRDDVYDTHDIHRAIMSIRKGTPLDDIKEIPSAEPKTGQWICGLSWKCSECGYEDDRALGTDFCPHCGARMVEPQESE